MNATYTATFHRDCTPDEKARNVIEPLVEYMSTEAPNVKRALQWAKSIAAERGWRLMSVSPNITSPLVP